MLPLSIREIGQSCMSSLDLSCACWPAACCCSCRHGSRPDECDFGLCMASGGGLALSMSLVVPLTIDLDLQRDHLRDSRDVQ